MEIAKNFAKTGINNYVDYGNVIFDEAYSKTIHQNFESFQYNACLTLSGAIRGSSRGRFNHELGLESLQHGHWYWKLYFCYKIFKENRHLPFQSITNKKI